VNQVRTDQHPPDRQRARAMGDEGMVTGVDRLAKHKVAGSTPVASCTDPPGRTFLANTAVRAEANTSRRSP
jgi:hypothetical protein